jgi:ubiquinone biosynthesis protein Coq4
MPRSELGQLRYQEQDSRLTLEQGLDEYCEANPGRVNPTTTSTAALGSYLANHDVSHVVFGTTTSLRGEILQDTWTFLAVDVSATQYVRDFIKEEEGKQIMADALSWGAIPVLVGLVWNLPRLAWRSSRMHKKWPWKGWEPYLDVPLADIRREFGIRIL